MIKIFLAIIIIALIVDWFLKIGIFKWRRNEN